MPTTASYTSFLQQMETVDRNENMKRILLEIHMCSRDKIVPRHHKPLSANASGLHLLPVIVTECGSTCTTNRTLYSSEVSVTSAAQRKGHALGQLLFPSGPRKRSCRVTGLLVSAPTLWRVLLAFTKAVPFTVALPVFCSIL